MKLYLWAALAAGLLATPAGARDAREDALRFLDDEHPRHAELAMRIWEWAEVGYQEEKSSTLLRAQLDEAGFAVETGVAGMPTAFVASRGEGGPVIAILAEFDALPGINQDAGPERRPVAGKTAGHACGHHLFGAGSTAAAEAIGRWLEATGTPGTVRLYGTPAEEGGAGKVYLVRAGLFDDVDAVLHWHASDENSASPSTTLANQSGKFRFTGVSAHAAGAPERGRSALDGVEAMNHMVNLLREHVPDFTRIHYVITAGGHAPNVVPDFAEVYYYVRHPDPEQVVALFERVVAASRGAALGTGTEVAHEIIHGIYSLLPNDTLQRAMHRNLDAVGGVTYDETELDFAERIQESFDRPPPLAQAGKVAPYKLGSTSASTDVGDVSYVAPTAGLEAATWVPGTAAHSWQAVAAGGTSIGAKGMAVAAKVLTLTAIELFESSELLAAARAELEQRRGPAFEYRALVGDRSPPLDYRR